MPEQSSMTAILDRAARVRLDLRVCTRLVIQQLESLPNDQALENLHYLCDILDYCHLPELEDLERAIAALTSPNPPAADPLDVPFDQLTAAQWDAIGIEESADQTAA